MAELVARAKRLVRLKTLLVPGHSARLVKDKAELIHGDHDT